MESRWGSWPAFSAALLLVSAYVLLAQESSATGAISMRPPDALANSVMQDMHIPTTPGAPFSAKSVSTLVETRHGSPMLFGFFSMVARNSSGRMYFESRRLFPASGEPAPRRYFIVIDPGEHTRTVCYPATKTCRINSFKHVSDTEPQTSEEAAPASTTESVSLGTDVIESVTVSGTREITTIAAGAYGNREPITTYKEVWHSPELDLDVSITRTDPRWGRQTRRLTEISRGEPDPDYFAIPADYKMLDNRTSAKQ
jgi:hypothetical protein